VLTSMMDAGMPRIARLRGYHSNKPDLPEMGKNLRESWEAFQRKAITNYGGLAQSSLCNRIVPNGLRIGSSEDHPALAAARRIWRDNYLDIRVAEAIEDAEQTGRGYLFYGLDDDAVLITREAPEQAFAIPDPVRLGRTRAAIKVWRDEVLERDFLLVQCPDPDDPSGSLAQEFTRSAKTDAGSWRSGSRARTAGEWEPVGEPRPFDGPPGVLILRRKGDEAFIEQHLDVIDRINLGKLNRLVITAMQAFRQRALKPRDGEQPLPDKDSDGNDIDWASALEHAPGAIWDLPIPIDIWESQPTDINPLLNAEKADARDFAALTGTPVSVLIPDGQMETAAGAAQVPQQQVSNAKAEIRYFSPTLALLMVRALRLEGVDLGDDTLEVLWVPPEHVSISERFDAATKAKAAGLSERTIKRDILGMSPDQIRQDETDKAGDLLAAALLAPPPSPNQSGTPAQPTPAEV